MADNVAFATKLLSRGVDESRPVCRYAAVAGSRAHGYRYRGTTVLVCDTRVVPVDLFTSFLLIF